MIKQEGQDIFLCLGHTKRRRIRRDKTNHRSVAVDWVDASGLQLDLLVFPPFGQLGIQNGVMMNEVMKQDDFFLLGWLGSGTKL